MKRNTIVMTIGLLLWGMASSLAISVSPLVSTPASAVCNQRFLTMPVWYRGLGDSCDKADIDALGDNKELGGKLGVAAMIVGLNIVEILMHLAAYIASAFVIFGGFQYMLSMGSPDGNAKGRKTIINAVIGLVISLIAITVVSYLLTTLI